MALLRSGVRWTAGLSVSVRSLTPHPQVGPVSLVALFLARMDTFWLGRNLGGHLDWAAGLG